MFEFDLNTFINDNGFNEKYIKKELSSRLTGHLYSGSPFETDDSCGNCDGGHCYSCCEVYIVSEYDVPRIDDEGIKHDVLIRYRSFNNKQEALDYYNSL